MSASAVLPAEAIQDAVNKLRERVLGKINHNNNNNLFSFHFT